MCDLIALTYFKLIFVFLYHPFSKLRKLNCFVLGDVTSIFKNYMQKSQVLSLACCSDQDTLGKQCMDSILPFIGVF